METARKVNGNGIVTKVRKIIKLGASSYVCLPREFVLKHNLLPGDKVAVVSDTLCKVIPMTEI